MPAQRPLRHDPIHEAIVDFKVADTSLAGPADLAALEHTLAKRFPKRQERRRIEGRIELRDGKLVSETGDAGFLGVFLKASDEKTIVQFRIDGFTLNRLKPYTGWSVLLPQVLDLWKAYVGVAKPKQLARIALRYINRLDIPIVAGEDFSVFLRSSPQVPAELPQELAGFQTRFTLVARDLNLLAHVTERTEETRESGIVISLDTDAYRAGDLSMADGDVAKTLEELRRFKNRIFFEMLTERALELYA